MFEAASRSGGAALFGEPPTQSVGVPRHDCQRCSGSRA